MEVGKDVDISVQVAIPKSLGEFEEKPHDNLWRKEYHAMYRKPTGVFLAIIVLAVLITTPVVYYSSAQELPQRSETDRFFDLRTYEYVDFPQYRTIEQASIASELSSVSFSKWRIEMVDEGYGPAMALDAYGYPHISYAYQGISPGLAYASFNGDTWQKEVALSWSDQVLARSTSLALDRDGRPHISYCFPAEGTIYECAGLVYTYYDNGNWLTEIVDQGKVGLHNSLRLDSLGRSHIAYYDQLNQDLKYAYHDTRGWHIQVVDSFGDVGSNLSLALDANDLPHISYCSDQNSYGYCDNLKYAFYDGIAWHIQVVDSEGLKGNYTSIAVDAADRPHISYCACGSDFDLKYAYHTGTSWQIQTVDEDGLETAIALDNYGRPHIAYSSVVDGRRVLKYAMYGGYWRTSVLEGLPFWSPTPYVPITIAVDNSGKPHIAYYGYRDTDLANGIKYAVLETDLAVWSGLTMASYRDMNWEIYTTTGDGAISTRRTNNSAVDSMPELNRGANRIAFVSNRAGNAEIYTLNVNGSGLARLTATPASESMPTWSPDGSKIAFGSYRDGNWEIYAMNADGSNQTRLTFNAAWDGHPTWSLDGTKIAFVSARSGSYELWTMNSDGTNQKQLSTGLHNAAYPDWSPDGSKIVFNDDYNDDGWLDLAIINADGTGLRHPLGSSPSVFDYLAPSWAPNGVDLAFARVQWINYQGNWYWVDAYIYGLNLSNSAVYVLVDSGYDWWPDWQTTDIVPPSSQVADLPDWQANSTFTVRWSGIDIGGSGLSSYDVQYRDGLDGLWTDWLSNTTQKFANFQGQDGHIYYFRSRARDFAKNLEAYLPNGETFTGVDLTPPISSVSSPEYATTPHFTVVWSGSDSGSGIAYYDVQYRDALTDTWKDWSANTQQTSAMFLGELDHTYYFRSRACDQVGHLESYPEGDGDTYTHTPKYQLTGEVVNNRHQPVFNANISIEPPALNTIRSDPQGNYALYFNDLQTYTLTVDHPSFAMLPPRYGIVLDQSLSGIDFVLPSQDDIITNGGWETGGTEGWFVDTVISPSVDSEAAHTGRYGMSLTTLGSTVNFWSQITQSVTIPIGWAQPTLSWVYSATCDNAGDTFSVIISSADDAITHSVVMTPSAGWRHSWEDLSAFSGKTVTLMWGFDTQIGLQKIHLDEISLGPATIGVYSVYLPVVARQN